MADTAPTPPTDQQMADALRLALAKGGAVAEVTIDGVTTRYDRPAALRELQFWERRAARAAGRRPLAATLDLRRAF